MLLAVTYLTLPWGLAIKTVSQKKNMPLHLWW